MTRRLYYLATLLFWLAVATFLIEGRYAPDSDRTRAADAGQRLITAAELARHNRPEDCWMAIRGAIYDLSAYLPEHPSRPEIIEPWCGKEASEAYATKTVGRPHSPHADRLLERYRIGRLDSGPKTKEPPALAGGSWGDRGDKL